MAVFSPSPPHWRHVAETLVIAAGGGALFAAIGFPAAWLAGAMCFSAIAALSGRTILVPQLLSRTCFVALGISLGAVATPETIAGIATWPVSIVIVCIAMGIVAVCTVTYLRLVHGWDAQTALLAGAPGALSQVMIMAAECGGDVRAIGIVQTLRVLILAVCIPGGLALFGLTSQPVLPASTLGILAAPGEFAALLTASIALAWIFLRIGFPGGLMFGPLVASATLHGMDFVHVSLPQWFANMAMIGLGAVAGSRFTGTPFSILLRYFRAAIGAFVVSLTVSASFALLAAYVVSMRISEAVVAYAPGAVDVMLILAFAMHLDPVFVGAHHLARIFTVSVALPIVVRWLGQPGQESKSVRPRMPKSDGVDD
jgi:membrane AbrB-like protein